MKVINLWKWGLSNVCWQTPTSTITNQQHCDPLPLTSKRSSERACFILHLHTHKWHLAQLQDIWVHEHQKFQPDLQIQGRGVSGRAAEAKKSSRVVRTRCIRDSSLSLLRLSLLRNKHPYGWWAGGVRAEALGKAGLREERLSLMSWVLLRFPVMKPF